MRNGAILIEPKQGLTETTTAEPLRVSVAAAVTWGM
jgi:hypothetical protein